MKTQKNICICQGCGNEHDLNETDSPLDLVELAAPELLEALKDIISSWKDNPELYASDLATNAIQAIAHAEGK